MLKALFFVLAALLPIALVMLFGFWVLLGLFALAGLTLLCSSRQAQGEEAERGGHLTGYHTTAMADL